MTDSITILEQKVYHDPAAGFDIVCDVCGFTFTSKSPAAKYCSTKCCKARAWEVKKARDAATAARKLALAST